MNVFSLSFVILHLELSQHVPLGKRAWRTPGQASGADGDRAVGKAEGRQKGT